MNTSKGFQRRRVLRGMLGGGAVSVGLPFLDCFLNTNGTALANGTSLPVCFGTWFWGCGLTPGRWEPNAPGKLDVMPVELKPLEAFKDRLNIYSGMKAFVDGKPAQPHYSGQMTILTGTAPRGPVGSAPSLDSLIADVIGTRTRFRSLEVTSTGRPSDSQSHRSGSIVNPAEPSPAALYTRVFGPDFKDPNAANFTPDPAVMARRSVLSAVKEQRLTYMKGLGAVDRSRLDEYFTSVRELEQQLDLELQKPAPLAACSASEKPGEVKIGSEIETVVSNHKLFAGLMTHALACDQTRVINVVFADPFSSLRKAGTQVTHHMLTHEEPVDDKLGYQPQATWFVNQIVEGLGTMISALDAIKEGDGTLLDRMLLLATSETGYAKVHSLENIPMITAGRGGGRIKTGLHVAAKGDPVTRVGLTLQQAYGIPVGSWGTESNHTSKTITEVLA